MSMQDTKSTLSNVIPIFYLGGLLTKSFYKALKILGRYILCNDQVIISVFLGN